MNIVIFGASGTIGQCITREALTRGHKVTAVVRNPRHIQIEQPHLTVQEGSVLNTASIAQKVKGQDAVISAFGPPHDQSPQTLVEAAHALLNGLTQADTRRLIVVGGAGSLEVAPGLLLMDQPSFPAAWRPVALAHSDALAIYRTSPLDWTYFSPADMIEPGQRTGTYRTGTNQLVVDAQGKSRISTEDFAVAILDELEQPHFIRQRCTVAY